MVVTKQELVNKLTTDTENKIIFSFNNVIDELTNTDDIVNVYLDMHYICVESILTYIMAQLRDRNLFHPSFTYSLPFRTKLEILKFDAVLKHDSIKAQLIFSNIDRLNEKDQRLFNELYYYNSEWFNIVTFVNSDFITYELFGDRLLEENNHYYKYELAKDKVLVKRG